MISRIARLQRIAANAALVVALVVGYTAALTDTQSPAPQQGMATAAPNESGACSSGKHPDAAGEGHATCQRGRGQGAA
jgi:cytochrome oxidase Cu insertion factor (SCO1/SenC/PrrC family)